jgi:hypothetical protein
LLLSFDTVVVCFRNRSFLETPFREPVTLLEGSGRFLGSIGVKQSRSETAFPAVRSLGIKTRPPIEERKIKRWKTRMGDRASEAAHMNYEDV